MDSGDGIAFFAITVPLSNIPLHGEAYTIIYNNIEYACICEREEDDGIMANIWGNRAMLDGDGNTGEPFVIMMVDTSYEELYGVVYDLTGILNETGVAATTASIGGISGPAVEIKVIDSKFLPKEINTNLKNGQTNGSLRGINTMEESETYTLGNNAIAFGYETQAAGAHAFAANEAKASGYGAFATGYSTASGQYSFAENGGTSLGYSSHAEGSSTAVKDYSHAEGSSTEASGIGAHTEGHQTKASGQYSHAEGYRTEATGIYSHATGKLSSYSGMLLLTGAANTLTYTYTIQNSGMKQQPEIGDYLSLVTNFSNPTSALSQVTNLTATTITVNKTLSSSALTSKQAYLFTPNCASGECSVTLGSSVRAEGANSYAGGHLTQAIGANSVATGALTRAYGMNSFAQGEGAKPEIVVLSGSSYDYTIVEGTRPEAGNYIRPLGETNMYRVMSTTTDTVRINASYSSTTVENIPFEVITKGAVGISSFSANNSLAEGKYSFAANRGSASYNDSFAANAGIAYGEKSHAENGGRAYGNYSHAEGASENDAFGDCSHVEGGSGDATGRNKAYGTGAHVEGAGNQAYGTASHAEGQWNKINTSGSFSHAEGKSSTSFGQYSHVENFSNVANGQGSHVGGNKSTAHGQFAFVHGNGCVAYGSNSAVFGIGTQSDGAGSLSCGRYNKIKDFTYSASSMNSYESNLVEEFTQFFYPNAKVIRFGDTTNNVFPNFQWNSTTGKWYITEDELYRDIIPTELKPGDCFVTEIDDDLSFNAYYNFTSLTVLEEAGYIYYNVQCQKFTAPTISANTASYAFTVGNGSSDTNRSNAHTTAWDGTGWFKKEVKIGGSGSDDANAKTLATEEYVDNRLFIVNITSRGEQESNTDLPGAIARWPIELDQTFEDALAAFNAGKRLECRETSDGQTMIYQPLIFGETGIAFNVNYLGFATMIMWPSDGTAYLYTND